jgi:predicted ArsR family transcriptional regulator
VNLRLALASRYVPGAVRRRGLRDLMRRTARAFGAEAPELPGEPLDAMLRRFALFTREQVDRVAAAPDQAAAARERLRREARDFGAALRRRLGVSSRAEAMRAARVLYRMLGVDLQASLTGSIVVRSCSFSSTYTCQTCAVMAAMDEGLFAGLAGEGRLEFAARITEGAERCVAFFTFEGPQP